MKELKNGKEIAFTGHDLGAAIACAVALRVLFAARVFEYENCEKLFYLGFGCPLFAIDGAKSLIEERLASYEKLKDPLSHFHFYTNEDDFVYKLLNYMTYVPYPYEEKQKWTREFIEKFFALLTSGEDYLNVNNNKERLLTVMLTGLSASRRSPRYRSKYPFDHNMNPDDKKFTIIYRQFGWWINLRAGLELVKVGNKSEEEGATSREHFEELLEFLEVYQKFLLDEDLEKMLREFCNHSMKKYVDSLAANFSWCRRLDRQMNVEKYLPNDLKLSKGTRFIEVCCDREYDVDIVVILSTPNLNSVFNVLLEIGDSDTYDIPVSVCCSIRGESVKYTFTCEKARLKLNHSNEKTPESPKLKLHVYSYFETVLADCEWTVQPKACLEKEILSTSLTNLYLHATYYIKSMQALEIKSEINKELERNPKQYGYLQATRKKIEEMFREIERLTTASKVNLKPDEFFSLDWLGREETPVPLPPIPLLGDTLELKILDVNVNEVVPRLLIFLYEIVYAQAQEATRVAPESPASSLRAIATMFYRTKHRSNTALSDLMQDSENRYADLVRVIYQDATDKFPYIYSPVHRENFRANFSCKLSTYEKFIFENAHSLKVK